MVSANWAQLQAQWGSWARLWWWGGGAGGGDGGGEGCFSKCFSHLKGYEKEGKKSL